MSKNHKMQMTTNYRMFHRSDDNRAVNIDRHKKLIDSMKKHGYLKSFPISCKPDEKGRLIVKDGQHRLAVAETLGLPVWWVEDDVDFDIAEINTTAKIWTMRDYAERFAQAGKKDYSEAIAFSVQHRIPMTTAFAMLAGTTTFSNIDQQFLRGDFKIKDREWAEMVANTYNPLIQVSPDAKGNVLLLACMAVTRVDQFDPSRLIAGAKYNPGMLKSFSIRDEFLTVLEELYNHKRFSKNRVPLKFLAIQAMAERNLKNNPKKKGQKQAVA